MIFLVFAIVQFGAWLSLAERLVRDQEVGGSNPLAPTIFTDVLSCCLTECPPLRYTKDAGPRQCPA